MKWIRKAVYRIGFRPNPGSIFFSPSINGQLLGEIFRDGFERGVNGR